MTSDFKKSDNPEDLDIRCPRLGGTVPFRYCMAPGEPIPCYKIFDCWWEIFDVVSFVKAHLPKEVFERLSEERDPPGRLNTILELIEKHKKKVKGPGQEET